MNNRYKRFFGFVLVVPHFLILFFFALLSVIPPVLAGDGWTSSHEEAVKSTDVTGVRQLITTKHINLNARCPATGYSLLHAFAAQGREDVLRLLLTSESVDPNICTAGGSTYGYTPLHVSVIAGKHRAMSTLLSDRRVDANAQDRWGSTPLHAAIFSGRNREFGVLLAHSRVNPNVRDVCGRTPLHYLVKCGPPQAPWVKENMVQMVAEELRLKRRRYLNHSRLAKHVKEECCRILIDDFDIHAIEAVRRAHRLLASPRQDELVESYDSGGVSGR